MYGQVYSIGSLGHLKRKAHAVDPVKGCLQKASQNSCRAGFHNSSLKRRQLKARGSEVLPTMCSTHMAIASYKLLPCISTGKTSPCN